MGDLNTNIAALVDDFMSKVSAVAREAAREALLEGLGLRPSTSASPVATSSPATKASVPTAAPAAHSRAVTPPAPPPRAVEKPPRAGIEPTWAKGEKRPTFAIHDVGAKLRAFIREHPGLRSEQIYAGMGLTKRDIALPLRKLVASGLVRSEGEKRSTRYFPAATTVSSASTRALAPAPRVRRRAG